MGKIPSLKLIFLSFFVSLCSNWQVGYQTSYINTSVRTFFFHFNKTHVADHPSDDEIPTHVWVAQWSLTIASFYIGALIGFSIVPWIIKKLGLNRTYIITGIPAVLGCTLTFCGHYFAISAGPGSENSIFKDCLIVGRVLCGITGGAAVTILPLWIRETSPPPHRAYLNSFQQIAQDVATLMGFVCGSETLIGVDYHFEFLQIVALIPTVVLVLLMICLPQTPHFHFHRKNDWNMGEKSIIFYYGKDTDIESATLAILQEWTEHGLPSKESQEYKFSLLLCPGRDREANLVSKGFLIGSICALAYGFTCDDIIDAYSNTIFQMMNYEPGTSGLDANQACIFTIAIGCWTLICTIIASFIIEKVGRRRMMIYGLFGTAIGNTCIAIVSKMPFDKISESYAVVGFVFFTKTCIGLGAGPPAWFLTSELVPAAARKTAQSLSTGILLCICGLTVGLYLILQYTIGSLSFIVLGSAPAALCGLVLLLNLPETKDKEIDEIQLQLGTGHQLFRDRKVLSGWSKRWKTYGSIPYRRRKNKENLLESDSYENIAVV